MTIDPSTPVGSDGSVAEFWQWGFSSLAENATRGVFAEYLVGLALGVTDEPRVEWDAADLRYCGELVEVKSSADNQTWKQDKPSTLNFDVGRKRWWNAADNTTSPVRERPAAVYVFSHFFGPAESASVVDPGLWAFYVVPTVTLDRELDDQKSARISTIRRLADPVTYAELRDAVDQALAAK